LWDGVGNTEEEKCGYVAVKGELESRRATTYLAAKMFFGNIPSGPVDHELHVFCEEPLALKNGKTTRVLGLAAGAIWAAFVEAGGTRIDRYWYWVDVAHWKKEVVGNGSASKEMIREFVRGNPAFKHLAREHNYDEIFEGNHNLYDAWCLQVYGSRQLSTR
jgi:hypothetical protein